MIIKETKMDPVDANLTQARKRRKVKTDAKKSRDDKKLARDKKEVSGTDKDESMSDMAIFNQGSYLQSIDTRKKLLTEYGLDKKWSIDEKNSGDDWVVYKRGQHEEGKPDNVIAYRGSAKARDWYTNSTIATNSFTKSPRYERSKKEFKRISNELEGTKMTTGHSLGGLIALSLGRDFAVPSVTFNRASGWDQLESDLDSVKSVNYTTNTKDTTDVVSLASSWAPSKGERVVPIKVKEGNESYLGAHGLDNFLPPEKTSGFLKKLNEEDGAKAVKSLTKDLYEGAREIGADKTVDKFGELGKSITWKMIMGYGTNKALEKLVERQMITGRAAERIQQFQAFYDNPSTFGATRLGNFMKKHLGSAQDFLKGKVKGTWEEIKSRMPGGDDMSEWEPETTGWDDKWVHDIDNDNPAYQEPAVTEDGDWDIDWDWDEEAQDENAPDPFDGFSEPEQFEDDEKGPGEWFDEHDPALEPEPANETFPELDGIAMHDVELGGEETAVAGAEEAVAGGLIEGIMAGGELVGGATLAALPLYYLHKDLKEKERASTNQESSQLIRNRSIAQDAGELGFDPAEPIEAFIKEHPEMETTLKTQNMIIDGKTQYNYDFDAFYGPRTAEYLRWRNENKDKLGDKGISVQEALDKLSKLNNPFTNVGDFQKKIDARRLKEKNIRSGLRYQGDFYQGDTGKGVWDKEHYKFGEDQPVSKRFKREGITNPDFKQRKMGEVERQDESNKQRDRELNEVIFRQTIDKTVTGKKTTDEKGNVHWRKEGEVAIPQADGSLKWYKGKGDVPGVAKPHYQHWKAEKKPTKTPDWAWDYVKKTYVHKSETTGTMPRIPPKHLWYSDDTETTRTAPSRSKKKDTHGKGVTEVDKNSFDGKGNVHQSLAGNNTKHTNDVNSNRNDRYDNEHPSTVGKHQSGSSQGRGKGIPEKNRQLFPPTLSLLNPSNLKRVNKIHHPMDALQPHGAADVDTNHNAPGHPKQTPAHQVAPGENHDPFSGTPGSSEHTFGVQGTGGITMRQLHQRSALQNTMNQAVLGQAADVNFMRSYNAREGRW
jgi:hypothetical protein